MKLDNIYHSLPQDVINLSNLFPENQPLYLVGGAVRDILLNKNPTDWDFATSAKPEEIIRYTKEWADGLWKIGIKFGTVGVIKHSVKYEITTFRSDVYENGTRKPAVSFSDTIEEDLIRRDFTINSIAYHIKDKLLIDPFNGLKDLKNKLLITPRDPEISFTEDSLRMLRAIVFTATLDMRLSREIFDTILKMGHLIKTVSAERITGELSKILLVNKPSEAFRLLFYTKLFDYIIPEISNLDIEQPTGFHHKNVLEHTFMVVDNCQPDLTLRLAALLHDIGKPKCRQLIGKKVHFYGHDIIGAKMAKAILKRLNFPKDTTEKVSKIVKMHMRPHTYREGIWTDSAIRRYIREAGDVVHLLNKLTLADCTSLKPQVAYRAVEKQKELEHQIEEVLSKDDIRAISPLVDGNKIMKRYKLKPGPIIGKIHKIMLEEQIDGKLTGEEEAWKLVDKIIKNEPEHK